MSGDVRCDCPLGHLHGIGCPNRRAGEPLPEGPVTADVQRELAGALRDTDWRTLPLGHVRELLAGASNKPGGFTDLAAALLPTVQALIADAEKRAAARALRGAADWLEDEDDDDGAPLTTSMGQVLLADREAAFANVVWAAQSLRDRAAALDPSGAAEGAGR